jgi:hypothetical protein
MTQPAATATRELHVEFLYLDLDTCTRCRATDTTLLEAIARTRPALDAAGVTVHVTKTLVASETQARELGFVSSPTIRINGADIAGELLESACDTCSETCPCNGGVACRDWIWQGQRSTQPPVGLIVEGILTHAASAGPGNPSSAASAGRGPREVPANLRQYFAAAAGRPAVDARGCCATDVEADCCAPEEKAGCCGDGARTGVAPAVCGCQS